MELDKDMGRRKGPAVNVRFVEETKHANTRWKSIFQFWNPF
jgi:hypothetical protein